MAYDPEQITFFAKTDARGQHVPFGIKAKDRTRHVYVIGKTGMGKSTLLENMAVQDMQHGNGLAFIDPHGATAETLLSYVPEDRADDVLYFAPFDTQHPIAFNVMEDVGPERRHLVAAGLMSVFKKIWVDAWSARMEYILQNTILALLEYPNSTLLGVNRMLSDKHYRKAVVDNIQDPAVRSFWVDEFANYNERYMQEAGDAIKNKIGQFTANPLIRNIIGQPHTSFDLRKMMDERKILIANLSKGLIGEGNANLLGSMLTTRVYLAAMSRADLSPQDMKQMPNFYFYVDEFQSFANATFADILSEARKYHLNLTIAHQYIEQMEEEVRNAVFGNVGTVISFRVGPFDAEILETIFAPQFYAVDIVNLGFAQIYLSLMIDGIGSRPFSATTLPPIEAPSVSCRDMVVARSRDIFAVPRQTVEDNINSWMAETFAPKRDERPASKSHPNHKGAATQKNGKSASAAGNGKATAGTHAERPSPRESTARASTPPPPDLNELRNVLKTIAQPAAASGTDTSPAHAAQPAEDHATTQSKSATTPSTRASAAKPTNGTPASAKSATAAKRKPEKTSHQQPHPATKGKRKQPATDDDGHGSLKAALATVLAEREAKRDQTATTQSSRSSAPASKQSADAPAASRSDAPATPTPDTSQPAPPANEAPAAAEHESAGEPADAPKHPTTEPSTPSSSPPPPPAPSEPYREAKSKDVLDPKVIERMLKVTGADNSPFKKR